MTLYRATNESETGIPTGSCWADEYETAVSYTEDGIGHGGQHIRQIEDDGSVLDLTDRSGVDFVRLAEALGYDDPQETAREWRESGWLYPWEESSAIRRSVNALDYDWIKYEDDYPDGAITYMRIA